MQFNYKFGNMRPSLARRIIHNTILVLLSTYNVPKPAKFSPPYRDYVKWFQPPHWSGQFRGRVLAYKFLVLNKKHAL